MAQGWGARAGRLAAAGEPLGECGTPALAVDLGAFAANCRAAAARLGAAAARGPAGGAVAARPHIKAHKCAELARAQASALGGLFVGVGCQTVQEAEVMAAAGGGVRDVLVTNQVVEARKVRRLADLALMQKPGGLALGVCVDSLENARALSAAVGPTGPSLGVVVECNVGQNRCGVETAADCVALAQEVEKLAGLEYKGIQAYHGALQHTRTLEDRGAAIERVHDKTRVILAALKAAGLGAEVVTGGGTGSFEADATSGIYTEVQPGSFFFGDVDYGRNEWEGGGRPWEQSMFVVTTVISRSPARRTVVVDAGLKAVSYDSGPPSVFGHEEWEVTCGGCEHSVVQIPEGAALPEVGSRLYLVPGHVDPTFNMHDALVCVRRVEGKPLEAAVVEGVFPIEARGAGF